MIKRTLLTLIIALGLCVEAWAQQAPLAPLAVYDARGKLVGRYESNGGTFNGGTFLGEAAIVQLDGVQVALPVSPAGFNDNGNSTQTQFDGYVYWTNNNCTGTPLLAPMTDVELGCPGCSGTRMGAPLVQNAVVVEGVAYFVQPTEYVELVAAGPTRICSMQATDDYSNAPSCITTIVTVKNAAPNTCQTLTNLLPATAYNLSNLGFKAPFSIR